MLSSPGIGVPCGESDVLTFTDKDIRGGLIAMIQAITPTAGEPYTLQAFVVVILGGLGRVSATVAGGLLFGLVEAFGQSIPGSGSVFANAIAFGLMVIVLVTRPQGLMGRLR